MNRWLALDVGGANLKSADGLGYGGSVPFPLWKSPERLAKALRKVVGAAPVCDAIVATMTGELADCYATKDEGVTAIVEALRQAAEGRKLLIYGVGGQFMEPESAIRQPMLAAASNWHALASFAARFVAGNGLLLDIGSTTTDIIPILDGEPAAEGRTDTQRLTSGELVYSGVVRTPICALVESLTYQGRPCPVAAELFATAFDAHLILGNVPEESENRQTADGRPATVAMARERLARMICADRTTFDERDALLAASEVCESQILRLAASARQVWNRAGEPGTAVICGQGEFLAKQVLAKLGNGGVVRSLRETLGPLLSQVAPAHALAILAQERCA